MGQTSDEGPCPLAARNVPVACVTGATPGGGGCLVVGDARLREHDVDVVVHGPRLSWRGNGAPTRGNRAVTGAPRPGLCGV